jgi:TolA-binding protein
MSAFWKIVVIIALVLVAMLVITFLSPDIKSFASDLAMKHHLPLWLVGLAAPILYAFKGLGNLLGGEGGTEKRIKETNQAIEKRLAGLETDVQRLDSWRSQEIERRMQKVNAFEGNVATMESREKQLDQTISGLSQRSAQAQRTMLVDPDLIE